MHKVPADLRVILIGGSSHVGKSTLADSLAAKLGWTQISTDKLARHPGRPWPEPVPDHVAEHYLSLSVRELIEDVLHHYKVNVWPQVEAIVTEIATDTSKERIIVEGSALWPEFVATLDVANLAAVWLTASDAVFEQRIRAASQYRTKSQRERRIVDQFLKRSLLYNAQMMDSVREHGLVSMDVNAASVDELTEKCLSLLGLEQAGTR
ncbi:MAG: AAA family ATPase [Gemmatimonadota bacterium]|nr:AAA family ATPase [Gemmatimonadota bacterium]